MTHDSTPVPNEDCQDDRGEDRFEGKPDFGESSVLVNSHQVEVLEFSDSLEVNRNYEVSLVLSISLDYHTLLYG